MRHTEIEAGGARAEVLASLFERRLPERDMRLVKERRRGEREILRTELTREKNLDKEVNRVSSC